MTGTKVLRVKIYRGFQIGILVAAGLPLRPASNEINSILRQKRHWKPQRNSSINLSHSHRSRKVVLYPLTSQE